MLAGSNVNGSELSPLNMMNGITSGLMELGHVVCYQAMKQFDPGCWPYHLY